MVKKGIILFCLLMVLIPACRKKVSAQPDNSVLPSSSRAVVIDGSIGDREYAYSINLSKMKVYLNRDAEKVAFALQAGSMGWVAIGFGSRMMDKAHMLMGYVKDGKPEIMELTGTGHRHRAAGDWMLTSSVLTETGGGTVFEGEVAKGKVITAGQEVLSFIVACGDNDNFTGRHSFRQGVSVNLK